MTRSEDFFVPSLTQNGNSCESDGECRHNKHLTARTFSHSRHAPRSVAFSVGRFNASLQASGNRCGSMESDSLCCAMFNVWIKSRMVKMELSFQAHGFCVTFVSASFRKSTCHRMTLLCDFHATTFCSTLPLPIPVSSSSPTTRISSTTIPVGTQHSTVGATPHVGAPAGFSADTIHDTHTQLARGRPRTFAVAAAKTKHSYLSTLGGMRCAI